MPLINTGTISTTQWIGADDMFVHQFVLDVNGELGLGMMMGDPEMPPLTLDMHLDVALSDINAPVSVVAPEGAEMIPAEQLEGLMGGF